jgi:DNA-binding transcriptional LysR family regulator
LELIENYLLEQFVAFAEYGTLLKTAEMLHISQPSLSRSMRKIEDEFGVSLFHRENSKIALSETGKVAAEYARRALDSNQEMIDRVIAFDRSLRTVSVGSCAPFPVNEIISVLQERLPGKTISSEITDDETLIAGLKNRTYQIVILHDDPDDKSLFCQRLLQENLFISLPLDHPLAKKKSVTLEELRGTRILMDGNVGFWKDICLGKLQKSDLLIQTNFDAFTELVEASSLPLFNTDQYVSRGYLPKGRISIPISDPEVHVTYWLAALVAEQKTYRSVFNALRGNFIRTT